ncbi:PKD domain-containing protein [Geodermatophilus sabuli]|uniref:PKD domain-containing protein n=1 Tax=Geodermatophilus sabuli TaxID=1564158 RepID=A0A7K3W758_9ACTN|nr:PKD domain-containing protein [Geodermatophilus sabuli]NEK60044.1 PKD domain-containing protein [Geodermatophilus sabuli]
MRKSFSALTAALLGAGSAVALSVALPGVASANCAGPKVIDQEIFGTTFNTSETRATGHNDITAENPEALRVWTEGATSTDKAAAYYTGFEVPLAAQTAQSNYAINYLGTPPPASAQQPGYQLVVDFDDNGTADGILIGEPVYGQNWWLNTTAAQFVKDGAPHTGGGGGSDWFGTLEEWSAKFESADIVSFGYSLGSGVKGDFLIDSIKFGCNVFDFQYAKKAQANRAPVAAFAVAPGTEATTTNDFAFDATGSSDPDGDAITRYFWDFGNGGTQDLKVPTTTYTYPADTQPGSYTVTLTVSDGTLSSTKTGTVTINPPVSSGVQDKPLPNTGADVMTLAALAGLGLVGSGAGIVISRRRKAASAHAA